MGSNDISFMSLTNTKISQFSQAVQEGLNTQRAEVELESLNRLKRVSTQESSNDAEQQSFTVGRA